MKPLVLFAAIALGSLACKPDPLAEYRTTCRSLEEQHALRAGLSLDQCARELKQRADLDDPARKASELVDRVTRLVAAGKRQADGVQRAELKDAVLSLQAIGRPATGPALSAMNAAADPDVRLALAKALVSICAEDCASSHYDCIVPALLEGTGDDKPSAVRIESEKGLVRCTGEQLGDDPAAWRKWWAERQTASR